MLLVAMSANAQENVRRNALKTTFLSWATGSVKLFYEHCLTDRQA